MGIVRRLVVLVDNSQWTDNLRGGAAGSASTVRKRKMKELAEILGGWISDVQTEDDPSDTYGEIMKSMEDLVNTWKTKTPKRDEVGLALKELVVRIKGEQGSRMQSFYDELPKFRSDKGMGKGKIGGKAKGKGKTEDEHLPRFDLSKIAPWKDVCSWKSVIHALELGETPRGSITICKDRIRAIELQELAVAHETKAKLTMIVKGEDATGLKNGKTIYLPWMGNLALVAAAVANLDGSVPDLAGENPVKLECETPVTDKTELESLRITVPLKYQKNQFKEVLKQHPEGCLKLLGCKLQEAKTSGWTKTDECINGYVKVKESDVASLLKLSGTGGVFIARLSSAMVKPPPVTWYAPLPDEAPEAYLKRVQEEGERHEVPLSFRRGGEADLGIQVEDQNIKTRAWAIFGAPHS